MGHHTTLSSSLTVCVLAVCLSLCAHASQRVSVHLRGMHTADPAGTPFATNPNPLLDTSVFSYLFYLNVYPDLTNAGIVTQDAAENHWLTHGIMEGRQACGAFSSVQYLARYPDIKAKYGSNYTAAIVDYVSNGRAVGRLGFQVGGAQGRWTISALWGGDNTTRIFVGASDRTAGAIDSIVWNNQEFINQWDHGRELQMAVTTQHGECYNPTEAGNRDDLRALTTTSVINAVTSTNDTLSSSVQPAFWMQPGEQHANPTPACHTAINTVKVSKYTMNKTVTLSNRLNVPNALEYKANILIPENQAGVQTEGPTGYMPGMFSAFYTFNTTTGELEAANVTSHLGGPSPFVLATPDGQYAMGAYSPNTPERGYAAFNFESITPGSAATTKWTVVFFQANVTAGQYVELDTFICIGTLNMVQTCMQQLVKASPPSLEK